MPRNPEFIVRLLHGERNPVAGLPSSYDLGEDLRLVLMSVTEGQDKPLRIPPFSTAPTLQSSVVPQFEISSDLSPR